MHHLDGTSALNMPSHARPLSWWQQSSPERLCQKEVQGSDLTPLTHPAHRTQDSTDNAASRIVTSSLLLSCFSCVVNLRSRFIITSPSHVAAFSAACWQSRTNAHRLQLVEDISGAVALSNVNSPWVWVLPSKIGLC